MKSVENTPVTDLLKTDEPVAIPSDLTPDEALNELVSSNILDVIPEKAAEELNEMNDEPVKITESTEIAPEPVPTPADIVVPAVVVADADAAVIDTNAIATATTVVAATETAVAAVVDEMNVESTEATEVASSNMEPENAMEAVPIKADEEKMDVDESNSTDAMDL